MSSPEMHNEISSKDNALIKQVMRLITDSSYRKKNGLAVISGRNLIVESQKQNILLDVLLSKTSLDKYADLLLPRIHVLSDSVINKINLVESDADIIGVIKIQASVLEESIYHEDCLVLENISDPGNLGTMLRAAGASGVKNIILSKNSVDVYSPKVLRSSAGIQFSLNILPNIELGAFLAKYQGNVLATTPHSNESIYSLNLTNATAWVFGNEGLGISPKLLQQIATKVKIPMTGQTESLNVAMAATVCLFEMMRQRSVGV